MRILLIIDSLGSGGAQRQFVGLAKMLKNSGYTVKVVYYHPEHFYKPFLDDAGIDNQCLPGAANHYKRIFKIAAEIRRFVPDTVISYLDTPNIIACLLKAIGFKYKLIVSERNTTQTLTLREKQKFFLMRWADFIVPNSFSQQKFIEQNFPNIAHKVTTITNFVDTQHFKPNNDNSTNRIIIVARISNQKNVLTFLDTVKILKDRNIQFRFDWYGSHATQHDYFVQCQNKIKELDIAEYMQFHPDTIDIVSEYQRSMAFCLPSLYEGFPNVVCEAMCCGLPVLCSDVCDNPTIVEDGLNGFLFDPTSALDMAQKIEKFLLLPPEQKSKMEICSRQLALNKFSADTFFRKYLDLINK